MHLDPFLYLFGDYIWYLRTVNTGVHPIRGIAGGGVCCVGCAYGAGCAALASCVACSSCSLLREFLRETELLRPPSLSMRVKVSDGC